MRQKGDYLHNDINVLLTWKRASSKMFKLRASGYSMTGLKFQTVEKHEKKYRSEFTEDRKLENKLGNVNTTDTSMQVPSIHVRK